MRSQVEDTVQEAVPHYLRSRRGRARLVVIIGLLSAFGPLSIDMYLPSLPSLANDLGASPSEGQLTLTACVLGLAVGQVIAGAVSDALGRRRPIIVGLVTYMLASFLCAFAPSVGVFIALRFIQGIAGAAGVVIARAVVRDIYKGDDVARFFVLTMLVNGLAPILAPVIGGQLLLVTNWRGVFVVLGIIGAGLVAAGALGLPESLPLERRRAGGMGDTLRTFRYLLGDRVLVGYALTAGFAFAAMLTYIAGSPFVLEGIFGLSPQLFSVFFGINALGIVIVGQVGGRFIGRLPLRYLVRAGLISSLAGGLLLVLAFTAGLDLPWVLLGFFLVVSSVGLIGPNTTALALAGHSRAAGTASALLGVIQYVIGGVVAPLAGSGGAGTALPMAFTIAACGVAALAAFAFLSNRSAAAEEDSVPGM